MANTACAVLESAHHVRRHDRTSITTRPALDRTDPPAPLPTDVATLDACLRGGLPRGQLCEISGVRSSGRLGVLLPLMTAAVRRGERVAFVDTFDCVNVASAVPADLDLARVLWIRGQSIVRTPRAASASLERAIDRALTSLTLVLRAGGFGVIAIDLAEVPLPALRRIPFTTWLRVQQTIAGSETACVLLTPEPVARGAGGLTLTARAEAPGSGNADRSRLPTAHGRAVPYSLSTRPLLPPESFSALLGRLNALMGEGRCGAPTGVDSRTRGPFAMAGRPPA